MRRKTLTKPQIVELTRELLHAFYSRDIASYTHYLSDNFIWIGAFDFQFTTSKQQFLDMIESELNAIPFQMSEEHYEFLSRDRNTFMLCCKFNLTSTTADGTSLQMHTRLTLVWNYIDDDLKLIHVHGSNAQDIPMTIAEKLTQPQEQTNHFINYITTSTAYLSDEKRLFRQAAGNHCLLSENDIVYLHANGQNTLIHTKDATFLVSGILQTHQRTLSDNFVRIHKSYLVNPTYLTGFRRYQAALYNHTQPDAPITLPIGKERYLDLKNRYQAKK